ncbi:MAG TPA: glycosyltransferase [Candidatus Acidoferrales bacterium]|nr:glycosyltransferase [Candidatus Acidoferrales bacterium]
MTFKNPIIERAVTVVTVTYGERRAYLRQVLDALPAQGVGRAVVVDNGARWPVKDELAAAYGDFVDVVEMGRNTGSAAGFGAGIRRALETGAEYIWLLDDDNRPAPDCLAALGAAYQDLRGQHPADLLAVLAFRPEHQADVAAGVPLRYVNPRRNSFRGFHVLDIPYKFWRRTPWGRPRASGGLPARVDLGVAPYSGLFFHRAVAERFGLPRADFVLYADDTEFTHRLTAARGRIVLITAAAIEDLESSWNVRQTQGHSFGVLLHQGSDFRAYYSARNQAYFEAHCRTRNDFMFALNRGVYLAVLTVLAFVQGRRRRLWLVRQAERDGRAARLGPNPRFPL